MSAGLANGVVTVVLPWLVLERSGSLSMAGVVAAISALPLVVVGLVAGTMVDLVGRRISAVGSDLLSAGSVAAVPILDRVVGLGVSGILVLAVVGAMFDPLGFTAREAALPATAQSAGIRPSALNGVHEATFGLAYLVGPGVGGLMIATVGAAQSLWLASAAFVLAAGLSTALPRSATPPLVSARPWSTVRASTLEGLALVRQDRLLRACAVLTTVVVGAWLPIEALLLPAYFQERDEPGLLGALLMVTSAGGVVGALLYAALAHRIPRHQLLVVTMVGTAGTVAALAALPAFPVLLVLGAMCGLVYGPLNPLVNLAMQERSPEPVLGRVVGIMTSLAYAGGPIGLLIAGGLVDFVGIRGTFAALAAVLVVMAAVASFWPSLRFGDPTFERSGELPADDHAIAPPRAMVAPE
jgi:MFS family permease